MKITRFGKTVLLFVTLTSMVITLPVLAQNDDTYSLTIRANVEDTEVFINAVKQRSGTPLRLSLKEGRYRITVRAEGYEDYNTSITLNRNTTITANLRPERFSLTVNSNVDGSSVYIDNSLRGTAPTTLQLTAGRYNVVVRARGYSEYSVNINLDRNTAVNALLKRMAFNLLIESNVEGADVFINGDPSGNTPMEIELQSGPYEIRVEAEGFHPFERALELSEDAVINAELEAMNHTLTVVSNVEGAMVFIDDEPVGETPLRIELPAARYALRVEAENFHEVARGVNLNQNRRVNATLKPSTSTVLFVVPERYLNFDVGNPLAQFRIFVDEKRQKDFEFIVPEGIHVIRITTGGLAIEGELEFEAGKNYVLALGLELELFEEDNEEPVGRVE